MKATTGLILILGLSCVASGAVPPSYTGKPFEDAFNKSGPARIPGIVQCALYDLGGEGVAYHDTDAVNNGSGVLNREPGHQRAHASEYTWHFRENEGVDISFVKDWADTNHPNPVAPPLNQLYIGWTADGEWTNYTVDVKEPGDYRILALYSNEATRVSFDINGSKAADCQLPKATGHWHTWDYQPIGTISFKEAGLQLLTFHYNRGNNFAFFVFEKLGPAVTR